MFPKNYFHFLVHSIMNYDIQSMKCAVLQIFISSQLFITHFQGGHIQIYKSGMLFTVYFIFILA